MIKETQRNDRRGREKKERALGITVDVGAENTQRETHTYRQSDQESDVDVDDHPHTRKISQEKNCDTRGSASMTGEANAASTQELLP